CLSRAVSLCACRLLLFFFFQAEDGIRDRNVTGVQTCALPISQFSLAGLLSRSCKYWPTVLVLLSKGPFNCACSKDAASAINSSRSEERRVGKEGRPLRGAEREEEEEELVKGTGWRTCRGVADC